MKTKFILGAGVGAFCCLAWAAKDPVIMTVNGVDVPKSEFEYLYHKNSQQQMTAQPLDEYVNMFVNYRLKVADAKALGIDTTSTFRQEMEQYRHDLAAPYLADSVYLNSLVEEAWRRSQDEVQTSHIMYFKRPAAAENKQNLATLDSLEGVLAAGGDFAELASKYSEDRGSKGRGGDLGYIVQGRFPYSFETVAYSLAPGEVSKIVESPVGYHIVKAGDRRKARGQVRAAHILIQDREGVSTPEQSAAAKAKIDSIYAVVKATPSKFEEMAIRYSEDPGSGKQGGLLPWFGSGQMVPEFENVAFALENGQISEPFRSAFGWHIISKIDSKGAAPLAEMKAKELQRIGNPQDERYEMVKKHQNEQLMKKHKGALNAAAWAEIKAYASANGLDSVFYETYALPANAGKELLKVDGKSYTAGEFVKSLGDAIQADPMFAEKYLDDNLVGFENRKLMAAEEEWLEANVADYRNLYHEYCNGSLLYEASVRNVWDKAAKDKEGLEKFFEAHRGDYAWSEPRAKGVLVQAKNDSIAGEIMRRYAELPKDEALQTLRKDYRGKASLDRVLLPKGQNAMVDNLLFGGPEATPSNSAHTVYFMLDGRLIDAPESAADVKGQVTGDYQEMLEENWVKELQKKYPVSINKKVLKKVK